MHFLTFLSSGFGSKMLMNNNFYSPLLSIYVILDGIATGKGNSGVLFTLVNRYNTELFSVKRHER